jgi:2-methylisocitrate lyase-like PEP mutase family enzyme
MASSQLNDLAVTFKSLHKPGQPIVVANVHDIPSAKTVVPLPSLKAIATASWGIAFTAGLDDDDLDLETNINGIIAIGKIARQHGKPMTCDIQDGYGERLDEVISRIIKEADAVGVNLEDYSREKGGFYYVEEAAERVKRALKIAKDNGVSDFVVNARCDILVHGGKLEEVVERGKKYLDAGATTCFVWAGSRDLTAEEVKTLVKEFDGRLAVLRGSSTREKLAELGVARISVGPTLLRSALDEYKRKALEILGEKA